MVHGPPRVWYQTWSPPEGVRTRSVLSSAAGSRAPRNPVSSRSVSNPFLMPSVAPSGKVTPGSSRSRSGNGSAWASMSRISSPAGPVATPTPALGRSPHQSAMRCWSRVAARWPWHGRPAAMHVHPSWLWPSALQSLHSPSGSFEPGVSGKTGQCTPAHQRAISSGLARRRAAARRHGAAIVVSSPVRSCPGRHLVAGAAWATFPITIIVPSRLCGLVFSSPVTPRWRACRGGAIAAGS